MKTYREEQWFSKFLPDGKISATCPDLGITVTEDQGPPGEVAVKLHEAMEKAYNERVSEVA